MLKQRFFSFGMALAIGFLLLVSLELSAGLAAFGKFFGNLLPMPEIVLSAIYFLLSVMAISVLFALILKFVRETAIAWKDVWAGANCVGVLLVFDFLLWREVYACAGDVRLR